MRKVIALAAALALGGCASTGGVTPAPTDISAEISQVQKIAAQVCSFVPTIETVSGLITVFVPAAGVPTSIAGQIADAICAAVAPKAMLAGSRAVVRGVPISGKYVQSRRAARNGVPVINGVIIDGYFVR